MPVYLVGYANAYAVLSAANLSVGLVTPKQNAFDQFWKFKFHFVHFPRNTRFLSFYGPINCLYLFKNHSQTSSWPGERPSCHLKVTKMWFGQNIKYLSEPFFANFCCREGISCLLQKKVAATHSFKFTLFLQNRSCSEEIS